MGKLGLKFNLSSKFIIGCSFTLLVALGATFYVINQRQEQLILQQAENEARAVFRQIVLMRKWIADHGGVFVERLPWATPPPHLSNLETIDHQGRRLVRETPAMVTKELADYAREKGLYWFHITSLKLINPENAPDHFERSALLAFERKKFKELISVETIDHEPYLRYISPLHVEEVCLDCHRHQGYQVGDIRGAISVTMPLSATLAAATRNRRIMFTAMLLVVVSLSGVMIVMMRYLVLTPIQRLSASINHFSEGRYDNDALPRTGDELEELSNVFAAMAGRLTEYHHNLEDKVAAATRDLASINQQLLEANHRLSAMNERKSDFIARASHELRTPLTSIKGAMEYVRAKVAALTGSPASRQLDELSDFLDLICKNTDRLTRMVNTMLDLERIETNAASVLRREPLDLAEVIAESVIGLSFTAAENEVQLQTRLPERLPLHGDEDRLRQVITNLLTNALKFAPARSIVTVRASATATEVRVEVEDQGPGVPQGQEEKIFDKFYKLGNKEGTGLGLSICRTIVEAHGGTIGAGSPKVGAGARLFFTLPRKAGLG